MKKGLTEVVFILDRSGSMAGLEEDTIGGFNSLLEKQKNEEGEAIISTVLFDDAIEILHDRVDVKNVEKIDGSQYYVRGCTALLDAIGGAVKHIKKVQKSMPENERPEKTLFIITTDGMENSSKKYNYKKVKDMIEKVKEKKGYEFLFLGANIDAIDVAGRFGIGAGRALNYHSDKKGTAINYQAMNGVVSGFRKAKSQEEVDDMICCCMAPVREDYLERSV